MSTYDNGTCTNCGDLMVEHSRRDMRMCQDEARRRMENKALAAELRRRCCPAGQPWTGDAPWEDHGHTDCWIFNKAADRLDPRKPS